MFHFVSITCTNRTEATPAFSAGNYDVSAKASHCEVRHYHCQKFGSDLSNFSPSWKGHNRLPQKGDSRSSSYRRSDEDVNSAFRFTGYFRWLTFSLNRWKIWDGFHKEVPLSSHNACLIS